MRAFIYTITTGMASITILGLFPELASAYNTGTWRYPLYYSERCGSVQMSCPSGFYPRCRDWEWECVSVRDDGRSRYRYSQRSDPYSQRSDRYSQRNYRSMRASVYDDPCWADPPDCGSWVIRCTSEGWRCDPPGRGRSRDDYNDRYRDTYYDRDPSYDRDYSYDRNTSYNRDYYNRASYDGDTCRPWVACSPSNSSCPSGTVCERYLSDYACVPTRCPWYR